MSKRLYRQGNLEAATTVRQQLGHWRCDRQLGCAVGAKTEQDRVQKDGLRKESSSLSESNLDANAQLSWVKSDMTTHVDGKS